MTEEQQQIFEHLNHILKTKLKNQIDLRHEILKEFKTVLQCERIDEVKS